LKYLAFEFEIRGAFFFGETAAEAFYCWIDY